MTYQSDAIASGAIKYFAFNNSLASTGSHTGAATGGGLTNFVTPGAIGTHAITVPTTDGTGSMEGGATAGQLGGYGSFTWEFFLKTTDTGTGRVIATSGANGTNFIWVYLDSGVIKVRVRNGSSWDTTATGVAVNDGAWHHIAVTNNNANIVIYVDGVSVGSVGWNKGSPSTLTSLYLGYYSGTGATAAVTGTVDEFAAYATALSSTTIANHYAAAGLGSTPGGYTAQSMLASASMPGGVHPNPVTVNATPITASATMPGGKYAIYRTGVNVTSATYVNSASPNTNYDSFSVLKTGGTYQTWMKLPVPVGEQVYVTLYVTSAEARSGVTVSVYGANGAWTPGTLTYNNAPSTTLIRTFPASNGATFTPFAVDVTSNGYPDGIMLTSSAPLNISSPEVIYIVAPPEAQANSVSAQPFIADTQMMDATVGTGTGITFSATVLEASADMPNPIVAGERVYTHNAEPMDAYAELTTDNHFALPVTVEASTMTASADMPSGVTVETAIGVIYNAEPMGATAQWIKPALVNGAAIILDETEDNYFQRVMGLAPQVWQRLNDQGSTATDRMGTYNGVYHGVQVGKFDAPEGRHSVHFVQGSYLEQNEPTATNADEAWIQDGSAEQSALEFSFKTSNGNVFLMAGADSTQTTAGVKSSYAARELFLVNGKLTFRSHLFAGTPDVIDKEFTGTRNLADNKWHHVVVKSGVLSRGEWGVELWVDGTFEIRRFNANGFMGFPDFIGFRPNLIDGSELPTLPLSQGFVGDMTEVIFYNHNHLASHDIARNYYAFMGWAPIYAPPMEASAGMGDNKGKGSQKKALYLYWSPTDEVFGGLPGKPGQPVEESLSFDPMPGFVERGTFSGNIPFTYEERVGDYHGFKVFSRSVTVNVDNTSYRDPITDDPSLINLEHDIDLSEYDVIMFKDWPDEGYELDWYQEVFPGQKERLLNQLLDANSNGMNLFVTNPRLAIDLGIIDRVEFVPTLRENKYNANQGAAFGRYDYGSAVKFPWNITASDGLTGGVFATGIGQPQDLSESYLSNKAFFYHDTNKNDRFRVRALIEGLTDIPGWMLKDTVFHVDYDQYGWQGVAYKYLKADEGLTIGDEFIFNGSEEIAASYLNSTEKRYNRFNGTWATPVNHVKAGVVVTTFGASHWYNKSVLDNPYKDYATTIVLGPGNNLNGRAVGGRIYVNFTEQPSYGLAAISQELPTGSEEWPFGYEPETTAQKEWDYSWTRTSLSSTQGSASANVVTIILPDGTASTVKVGDINATTLSMVRSSQLFPLIGHARMEMNSRGMFWLAQAEEIEPGAVVVRATPMEASAEVVTPTVVAQRSATVRAQVFNATAQLLRPAEDTYGDVIVRALPMTAEATFSGYTKTVYAEPMLAEAEMVEMFDPVHAGGEQVSLTLHNFEATLYLKEDA